MTSLPIYRNLPILLQTCNNFVGQTLRLTVNFMGHDIPVTDPNVVGNVFETIAWDHFRSIGDIEEGPLQDPPDFYAQNREFNFEVKTFRGSPGFDLSSFLSYINQLCLPNGVFNKVFRTDYLVFEYSSQADGSRIEKFYHTHIWKMVKYGGQHPLSAQVKGGVWNNLRPCAASGWNDTTKTPAKFIDGIIACIEACPQITERDGKIANIREQFSKISSEYAV